MDLYHLFSRLGLGALVATAAIGCAQERETINRVDAYALSKKFFVGPKLNDASDDPEFYASTTVIDVPFGVQAGVFGGLVGDLRRIKWEITQEKLNARMTYENVQDSDGNGTRTTNSGQIVASFTIESHFDIKREYNPQTGEELNVIGENTSDRPWHQREYFRVDWSSNLLESALNFDPMALDKMAGQELENISYRVEPNDVDAPVFSPTEGYFDITNKVYIKPLTIDGFPSCWYYAAFTVGATGPFGACEPSEVKLRLSFLRVPQRGDANFRDYEPKEWDGARFNANGAFYHERVGYDKGYGVVDAKWHHLLQRYNIWDKSHTDITCTAQGDTDNGGRGDGTDDQCATAGAGSRCDDLAGLCTIPFSKRATRPNAWHYNVNGEDEVIFDSTNLATEEWDTAMRIAVQAARRVECLRTAKASIDGTPWAGMECTQAFPIVQTDDAEVASVRKVNRCWKANGYKAEACKPADPNSVAALDPIIALCHNPVRRDDDPMCGAEGLVTRVGDLRYHQVNVFPKPQAISTPWGYGPTLSDPLTGEVISAGINVWNYVTDLQAQTVVDQIRYMNGELQASEITSSPYVDGSLYSRASSAHYPGSAPLMTRAEIDQRVLGTGAMTPQQLAQAPQLRKDLDIRKMTQDLAARSAEAAVGFAAQSAAAPGGAARTQSEARIALAKGTPIEAQLMGQAWVDMSGVDPSKVSHDELLNRASPLRGLDGHTIAGLEQHVQAELARKGQCMMSAPEPTGLVPLAKIMKDKFPYVAGASAKDQADRITTMKDYLRGKLNYAVIAHEMGHTVGMRHNFASSWDRFNYRPQYWQLRTRGGTVTEPCTGPVADGATCVGPRYYDPLDQDEQDQMIWMWSQTTVMDYAGDITQDMLGLGVYDYAAARAFYSDVVDVRNDGVTVPPPGTATAALTPEQLVGDQMFDMIDGASFPLAQAFVNDGKEFLHYSKWNNFFHMLNKDTCKQVDTSDPPDWNQAKYGKYSAVFDGHIVRGEQCERMPVDYVDWRDMVPDTTRVELTNYNPLWILARRAVDNKGRPRMPYAFCTDNWVESGSSSCYQHDNGADIFEEMMFHDRLYEDRHIFDNFRRGKSSFSLYGAYQRSVARYHNKIETLAGYVSFLHDNILHDIANKSGTAYSFQTARYESEGAPLRDYILAASFGFDHFTRSIARPQPGPHFLSAADGGILRPLDDGSPGSQGDVLDMPQGSAGMGNDVSYGGRPIQNGFVASNGYYVVNSAGSYYDKTHAMLAMLNQGIGHGNWNREQGVDGRLYTANLTGLYPEGARRLLGSLLTEDQALYAPRVASRQSGFPTFTPVGVYKYPSRPVGWVTFTTPGGPATCWPMNGSESCADNQGTPLPGMPATAPATSVPIDPELGFEVQKFILFYSYVFLPASQRNDWLDMLRLYKLGGDVDPAFDASTLVEWQDPQSGYHYLAKRFGDEQIMGKTYDKGIAAKMLQWANTLASRAYEPADPLVPFDPRTGRFVYKTDARGVPVVKKDPVVAPDDAANVRCDENMSCLQLRNYRALLDFSRDIGTYVGFGSPCLNGINRPGVYCE